MTDSSLPVSTSDVTQGVRLRLGEKGLAAEKPKTVMQNFDLIVKAHGDKPALHQKVATSPGQDLASVKYTTWTWKEYRAKVDSFAKSLLSLGFQPFDIINILGFNSRDWFVANFGAIAAGGVAAGIYSTNLAPACKYISEHSEAKVVVVEGLKQLEKYLEIASDLPHLKAIVMYGPDELPDASKCLVPMYTFDSFLELGKDVADSDLQARSDALKPEHTCTLIYTSGTTGQPKAVMITHDNITWTAKTMMTTHPKKNMFPHDKMISYLPLSHIAAQQLDMHVPMSTGAQIYFAQPDALKGSLGATLKAVRPTAFFGVPRVWEKIYDKMQEVAKETKGIKKSLSTWAKKQALTHWESHQFGEKPNTPMLYGLAKKLLHKAHVALGLDRCDAFFVSAAPIEVKILKYFASIDLPIMELFGQSECTGPHAVNCIDAYKIGTVGRPMLGTETRKDPETGELQYRGRHIFAGYMKMPEKTKETINSDGWLLSGDVVAIDDCDNPDIPKPSGFISITGRIKELIITAGGENVPPVLIEEQMKLAMPALANCMVIGDKRKFLSILLCLQVEVGEDGVPTNKLTGTALDTSKEIGSSATTTDEVQSDDKWKAYFDKGVETANEAATSRAQKVAKWSLLTSDFSEPGGELTPTLKLKRSVAADKYTDVIEGMYGGKPVATKPKVEEPATA
eukprot:CAMPEP_0194049404 /NCGR_PEP_ID=MMETSP0009_2-20130614/30632_1 /TAXON_ID=210454 /ORGANISM="Grammatophora oceanica, Strain CCMP 410" /LENGTH=680 /DNA_ID=CAMNT_0038695557 /DNA_START=51 /DNA_END=2093 /DNA_ORIENTATION=+